MAATTASATSVRSPTARTRCEDPAGREAGRSCARAAAAGSAVSWCGESGDHSSASDLDDQAVRDAEGLADGRGWRGPGVDGGAGEGQIDDDRPVMHAHVQIRDVDLFIR